MSRWLLFGLALLGGVWTRPPVVVVLILNLIPVACVWWLGWNALTLLVLYWAENVVIGVVNWLKIRTLEARGRGDGAPFKVSGFFAMHYGIFTLVHGVFAFLVGGIFAAPDAAPGEASAFSRFWSERESVLMAVAAIAVVHVAQFFHWLGRKDESGMTAQEQMIQPYGRIFIMHITIIGGAFLGAMTGAPASYVLLLAILKTVIDTLWASYLARGGKPVLESRVT